VTNWRTDWFRESARLGPLGPTVRYAAKQGSASWDDTGERRPTRPSTPRQRCPYWTELATEEKTLLALEPMSRMVPTTITRITASITAYSAISWPRSSAHILRSNSAILSPKPTAQIVGHHHDERDESCQCQAWQGF